MKTTDTIQLEVTQEELAMIINALVDSMLPSRKVQDLVRRINHIIQASNPTPPTQPPAEEPPK